MHLIASQIFYNTKILNN